MTRTLESTLHRPVTTLLRPGTDDAIAVGAVRAQIRTLVSRCALDRREGADLLLRFGPPIQPYRWAVAVIVSVTVTITASNDRYAVQAGIGQFVVVPGRLRAGSLTSPTAITAPADAPASRPLQSLTCRRVEAYRGYPAGGAHHIGAVALTAVTVAVETAAIAAAHARFTTDLARLTDIQHRPTRIRQLGVPPVTGLDTRPPATPSVIQPGPSSAPPTSRSRTAEHGNRAA